MPINQQDNGETAITIKTLVTLSWATSPDQPPMALQLMELVRAPQRLQALVVDGVASGWVRQHEAATSTQSWRYTATG